MKTFRLKRDEPSHRAPDYTIPYQELLNDKQLEAVFHDKGPALVIAGAGTGKTRTLTHRVARLIESGVHPQHILLLTFTRRAAKEMVQRASSLLDGRCSKVRGGTLHFYCSQVLHRHAERLGYPPTFTIIDTADALDIIQFVRVQLKLNQKKIRFPNKRTLLNIISTCKNKYVDLQVVLNDQYPQFAQHKEKLEEVALAYDAYKEKNHVMDFDDLLIKTNQLLEQDQEVRQQVAIDNHQVMVDEYQDTNKLQAKLTRWFSSYHQNLMAVGDDAQSIYAFRGADHKNMLAFPEEFSDTKIIKLEENYRSTTPILSVANAILKQASYSFDKELFSRKEKGERPALVKSRNQHDQSRFIAQLVLQLREQHTPLAQIAVLFRNGRDAFDLEVELNRTDIPYIKYGGQKFTEAAHIKDVLAHVRVLVNPLDTIAWNRVLMLMDGIGPKTALELFEWIRRAKDPYLLELNDVLSEAYKKQLSALSEVLISSKDAQQNPSEVIGLLVEYYRVFCEKRFDDYPKRIKDLEVFAQLADNFVSIAQLLEELALDPITNSAVETEQKKPDEPPMVDRKSVV